MQKIAEKILKNLKNHKKSFIIGAGITILVAGGIIAYASTQNWNINEIAGRANAENESLNTEQGKTKADEANSSEEKNKHTMSADTTKEGQTPSSNDQQIDTTTKAPHPITLHIPSQSPEETSSPSTQSDYPHNSFIVEQGPLIRTDTAQNIIWTAHLTLTPTYSKFGNPTITAGLGMAWSPGCLNKGEHKSFKYNNINHITVDCIVNRCTCNVQPTPLPNQSSFVISVHAVTDTGFYTYGGSGISYVLPYGYDR